MRSMAPHVLAQKYEYSDTWRSETNANAFCLASGHLSYLIHVALISCISRMLSTSIILSSPHHAESMKFMSTTHPTVSSIDSRGADFGFFIVVHPVHALHTCISLDACHRGMCSIPYNACRDMGCFSYPISDCLDAGIVSHLPNRANLVKPMRAIPIG